MARGRKLKLTPDIQAFILRIKTKDTRRSAKDLQDDVSNYLMVRLKKDNPKWTQEKVDFEIEDLLPGVSSISGFLTESKPRMVPNPIDQRWSLATLKDYPLPSDVVAKIFAIRGETGGWEGVTIRESMWVSRLASLPMSLDYVRFFATAYADTERFIGIAGMDFDSSKLDVWISSVIRHPEWANSRLFSDSPVSEDGQASANAAMGDLLYGKDDTDFKAWLREFMNTHDHRTVEEVMRKYKVQDTESLMDVLRDWYLTENTVSRYIQDGTMKPKNGGAK